MPIEMPKGLPFSVDTWSSSSMKKRHHFLTHAHRDHSTGISTYCSYPIYCTSLTKTLLLQQFPKLDDCLFLGIELGQSLVIDDPDGPFKVMAMDANHCPGAVMFSFEGTFGNILHTGDCRLTPECLLNLQEKYLSKRGKKPSCQLDFVFLDCTFGRFSQVIPSKHLAVRQVINCIWKHPEAPVIYLACDLLGQEEILADVSRTFGSKIYVDKSTNPECFLALTLTFPEILSQDPSSRFHLIDAFPRLNERAKAKLEEAQANLKPEPLIIRPSTQWYAHEDECSEVERWTKQRVNEAVRDQFGVWHVCYSIHSSRDELEWALQLLAPKWVISTTPPSRAMDLDYVKKHCLSTRISSNNPLWRLLDISVETSSVAEVSVKSLESDTIFEGSDTVFEGLTQSSKSNDSRLRTEKISTCWNENLNLSPPSKRQPITLFGRARLGFQESSIQLEQQNIMKKDEPSQEVENKLEQESSYQDENSSKVIRKVPLVNKMPEDVNEIQFEKDEEKESKVQKGNRSPIGSSKCFNGRLRKLYRSMNVPVPQPLPSLVDLLKANKRFKREFKF
ncbi:hypothetical protein UlMin_037738 [Ulmus minor]